MKETCETCENKVLEYIYYNPVSSDVIVRLCEVCDKELIESNGFVLLKPVSIFRVLRNIINI